MALTPTIQSSGLLLQAVAEGSPDIYASSLYIQTVFNYPTENILASELLVTAVTEGMPEIRVPQLYVQVVVRGRVENPIVRAWTFTLDGHDYYVLRLGDTNTLVYDTYSKQWMDWADLGSPTWRANYGVNWIGGQGLAIGYGSDVVAGDDNLGLLWFLSPEQPFDGSASDGGDPIFFDRITMGQLPMTGREVLPCYAAWLTTDMGEPAYTGAAVTLEISDDAGVTFNDMGSVEVSVGTTNPQLSWYSLGQIGAPGRLFKITNDGAVARIDSFEMNDPDDDDG